MNLLKNYNFYIISYLLFSTIFTQGYKVITKSTKKDSAITILIGLVCSLTCIFMIPLFKIKFPSDKKIYIFLFLAIIFYAINNRLGTTARKGLEVSTYSILKQLSTVFILFAGIIFFKETFILNKMVGGLLIILSNVLIFYNKSNFKYNKYLLYGILANISLTIALFIDVNYSNYFNIAFYILLIFLIPSILIFLFERVKIKDIVKEYKNSNKLILFLTSISWIIMLISKLKAYQYGKVVIVAPLCSLTVILNIILAYFLFKEKNNLLKKIISSILIIIGIILIKI